MSIINFILTALLMNGLHLEKCLIENNDHDHNEFMQNLKYEWTVVIKDITENSNFRK